MFHTLRATKMLYNLQDTFLDLYVVKRDKRKHFNYDRLMSLDKELEKVDSLAERLENGALKTALLECKFFIEVQVAVLLDKLTSAENLLNSNPMYGNNLYEAFQLQIESKKLNSLFDQSLDDLLREPLDVNENFLYNKKLQLFIIQTKHGSTFFSGDKFIDQEGEAKITAKDIKKLTLIGIEKNVAFPHELLEEFKVLDYKLEQFEKKCQSNPEKKQTMGIENVHVIDAVYENFLPNIFYIPMEKWKEDLELKKRNLLRVQKYIAISYINNVEPIRRFLKLYDSAYMLKKKSDDLLSYFKLSLLNLEKVNPMFISLKTPKEEFIKSYFPDTSEEVLKFMKKESVSINKKI